MSSDRYNMLYGVPIRDINRGTKTCASTGETTVHYSSSQRVRYYYCLFLLFLALLFISHLWPQQTFPWRGIFVTMGLMVLTLVTVVLQLTSKQKSPGMPRNKSWPGIIFYLLFLVWLFICWLRGPVPAMAIDALGNFLMGFWVMGITWLLASQACQWVSGSSDRNSQHNLSSIVRTLIIFTCGYFALLALISSIKAIYQYFWGFERDLRLVESLTQPLWDVRVESGILYALREKRVFASFGNPNIFCGFLAFSLPFILLLLFRTKQQLGKIVFLLVALLLLFSAYLSKSRGGWLAILLACLVSFLFLRPAPRGNRRENQKSKIKNQIVSLLLLLVLCRPLISAETPQAREGGLIGRLTAISTVKERGNYLYTGWQIIRLNPLWGKGLGSYEIYYPRYKAAEARETKYAHNFIAQLWAETGLLGLFLFGVVVFFCLSAVFSRLSNRGQNLTGANRLSLVLVAGIIVFLFDSLIDYTFYFREVFLDFCLCAGLLLGIANPTKNKGRSTGPRNFDNAFSLLLSASVLAGFFIIIFPQVAAIHSFKGHDQVIQGELNNAVNSFAIAVKYQPGNPWYHHQLGRAYIDQGQWSAGIDELKVAKKLNPYSAFLSHELAMAYTKIGQIETALEYEKKAIQLYPLKSDYHFHFSVLLSLAGDYSQAIKQATEAIELEYDIERRRTMEEHLNTLKLKGEPR